ncbi:MAG: glycosyltransferase family 4 protein [Anaerolineae bacterium]
MAIRVIGLAQGRVDDPFASSGLNQTVFGALAQRTQLVDVLDVSLHGWQRWWNAIRTWHPDRDRWRERFDLNVRSFMQLSHMAGRMLAALRADFDLVFQLRTMYAPGYPPGPWPYAILVDNTYVLSDRYYPPWAPMGPLEKSRWLELERVTYHQALAVFARTHWVRNSLIEDYGLPPERAVWVGTGCHFALETLPESKESDDGRTVLFVGKDFKRKGVPTLLEAFVLVRRRLPDARLILVGRDVPIHQDGVEVLGKVTDRSLLRKLYTQASVFVLPSHFEPCSNVISEAMAYRLPCIVTTAGGLADLVSDGETGYVIPPGRPDVLADRILDLLSDPDKRRRMGECGARQVREELNWERVVERIMPYLEQALRGRK